MSFEKLTESIYRLCVPFENIYTAVFALRSGNAWALLDGATTKEDAENYILPALKELGAKPEYIFCSHLHDDHAGGIFRISEEFTDAPVVHFGKPMKEWKSTRTAKDGEIFFERFTVLNLSGHADECLAVLDIKDKILLSVDALQPGRVGRFLPSVSNQASYAKTLRRVKNLDLLTVITSHDYDPFGCRADGQTEIEKYLLECEKILK